MNAVSRNVLDSWAMVAWIRQEPAAPLVRQFILEAEAGAVELTMSRINAAETFYILAKRNSMALAELFLARLPSLPIRIVTPGEDGIMAAARIKARHTVAFGDAFAIALAQAEDAAVITGDEEIRRCRLVRVAWVGATHRR